MKKSKFERIDESKFQELSKSESKNVFAGKGKSLAISLDTLTICKDSSGTTSEIDGTACQDGVCND